MRDQQKDKPNRLWSWNHQVIPRPFQVVIVDEADNLFIDSALHSARIALPYPSSRTWIYEPILHFIQTNKREVELALDQKDSLSRMIDLTLQLRQEFVNIYPQSDRGILG